MAGQAVVLHQCILHWQKPEGYLTGRSERQQKLADESGGGGRRGEGRGKTMTTDGNPERRLEERRARDEGQEGPGKGGGQRDKRELDTFGLK